MKREITRDDIIDMESYGATRRERRRAILGEKKDRRVPVGPVVNFHFETYDTMWLQVHEMLYIEQGGEEQIPGELEAYNPLIPKGDELVATVLFEIEDPEERRKFMARMGGVEDCMFMEVNGERIRGREEGDVERSTADGQASTVHFVHFHFTPGQIRAFQQPGTRVLLGIEHPNYSHMAVLPEATRASLAGDFASEAAAA